MRALILLPVVALALTGCSKDESSDLILPPEDEPLEEQAAAAQPAPQAAPVPAPASDVVMQDLNAIPANLDSGNYDAAVTSLSAMRHVEMDAAQKQAYRQSMFDTQQYLLQQAQSDPKAQEAYNRLGRQVMGR